MKLDLVNWTMRAAKQLRPEHHMHSDIAGSSSPNNILLGAPEGERGEPSSEGVRPINVRGVQLTVGSPTAGPPSDLTEEPKPDTASDLPAYTQAPSAPVDSQAAPMSALLKLSLKQISIRFRLIANGPSPFVGCYGTSKAID